MSVPHITFYTNGHQTKFADGIDKTVQGYPDNKDCWAPLFWVNIKITMKICIVTDNTMKAI